MRKFVIYPKDGGPGYLKMEAHAFRIYHGGVLCFINSEGEFIAAFREWHQVNEVKEWPSLS